MNRSRLFQSVSLQDLKQIRRDRFLLFMLAFTVFIAVVLRYLLPFLNTYLAREGIMPSSSLSLALSDIYPLLIAYFGLFQGATLVGTIYGFLFLDEKDMGTLKAMLVTPVPFGRYLMFRCCIPAILSFFVVIGMVLCMNQSMISLWKLCCIAIGSSLTSVIFALFFPLFSQNKVQGFANAKFGGLAGVLILVSGFIKAPYQWFFGLFPPFWVSKAYWMALAGNPWWGLSLMVGIFLQLVIVFLMIQRFQQVAYKS